MIMKIRLWKMDSINQKSTKLMKTFRLIPIVENINQYDNDAIEIISNEFYCWPLIMVNILQKKQKHYTNSNFYNS